MVTPYVLFHEYCCLLLHEPRRGSCLFSLAEFFFFLTLTEISPSEPVVSLLHAPVSMALTQIITTCELLMPMLARLKLVPKMLVVHQVNFQQHCTFFPDIWSLHSHFTCWALKIWTLALLPFEHKKEML